MRKPSEAAIRRWLEEVYAKYHRRDWIGSDPVQFLHRYSEPRDQEVVGLIASSLAYGQVATIHASVERVLVRMGPRPADFLFDSPEKTIIRGMAGFRHRWTGEAALSNLLVGMRRALCEYGSLGKAFIAMDGGDIQVALGGWVRLLQGRPGVVAKELLADPERNSACKRLHLYMRWMVRHDEIDPGCWASEVDRSRLMMPVDTHVFRWARWMGFTRRNTADGRAVSEITGAFRRLCPEDPVKYDFSLTRPGIVERWRPHDIAA